MKNDYTTAHKFETEACILFYSNKYCRGNNYTICATNDGCQDVTHTWGKAISSFELFAAADGVTLYSETNYNGYSQHYGPTETMCSYNSDSEYCSKQFNDRTKSV